MKNNNGQPVYNRVLTNTGQINVAECETSLDWSAMGERDHFVQFYEADKALIDSLSGYIGTALVAGEAAIVIATPEHRLSLNESLEKLGVNWADAEAMGQYVLLDAAETLTEFMVGETPDARLFETVIGGLVARMANGYSRVRGYGEMVALLWADGNKKATIALEELWNDLGEKHSFTLFCAYPICGFGGEQQSEPLAHVCQTHSRVIPAESYTELKTIDDRSRTVIELQQKARSLEAEVQERKRAEMELLQAKVELETQVEDLRRLHETSLRLTGELDLETVLNEVLREALAVQKTDLGILSIRDLTAGGAPAETTESFRVQSGFNQQITAEREFVESGGVSEMCYEVGSRVVIEDVVADPIFAQKRSAAMLAGVGACHSTPLVTRAGKVIGVLSVFFRRPNRATKREIRLMDLYARMAADLIENAQLHNQVQAELRERAELLEREQNARGEAESANRLKDEFLATVSHELRTPLNAIIGWAHLLRAGGLDESAKVHAVETIERNARSQAQLIEDILDVSRVITGKLLLKIEQVDLSSIINAAIDSVQLAADAKKIQLEVALEPSARHLSGDAGRLQQIAWNLLSNAIKFTPSGGRIRVGLKRADSSVQITVTDTGKGINAEFLPFIFDRFRQGDGTSTRRYGGLGLGLAIVRHLIELHGGTVIAESAGEGKGSTFTISLPFSNDCAQQNATATREPGASEEETNNHADSAPKLDKVQILVVDDDSDTLEMLAFILRKHKASVQTANSVAQAFEVLQSNKPDLLICDLAMPDEDGYQFIRRVKASDSNWSKPIPAIALTAFARVEDRVQALAAGFEMFVPKPVEPNELVATVANLIERERRRS